MRSVFISYRRGDSTANTGRLYADLERKLGREHVFRDVDGLELGVDFVDALDRALAKCKVMLVMIGRGWVTAAGDQGRRLDQEDDFVRIEVAAALARKDVRVIPVLVDGASMPNADELPENIRALARRHAFEISERHWDFDVTQLADALIKNTGIKEKIAPSSKERGKGLRGILSMATGGDLTRRATLGVVLLAAIGVTYVVVDMRLQVEKLRKELERREASVPETLTEAIRPDFSAPAAYGDHTFYTLSETHEIEIIARRELDASVLGGECAGQVATAPDVTIDFQSSGAPLSFRVLSNFDATLVINTPFDQWLCDDDSAGNIDALVEIANPDMGPYDVWIGALEEWDSSSGATLTISHSAAP